MNKLVTTITLLTYTTNSPLVHATELIGKSNFSVSLGVIDRFFQTMPNWVIVGMFCLVLVSVSVSLFYTVYLTVLKFIERWTSFKTKLASEKKARNDLSYGVELDDVIKKAFDAPEYKRSSSPSAWSDSRDIKRLQLLTTILTITEKHLDLRDRKFRENDPNSEGKNAIQGVSVHDAINEFIKKLKNSEILETI